MKEEVSFHAIYPFRMLKSLQVKIVLTKLSLPLWHLTGRLLRSMLFPLWRIVTFHCTRFGVREMAKMETIDATIKLKSPILESAFGILGKQCFQLQLTKGCVLERLC